MTETLDQHIGGKALNLAELQKLNIQVPKWKQLPVGEAKLIKEGDKNAIRKLYASIDTLFGYDASSIRYAVRSSAVGEDGKDHSFAGLFNSYLNVDYADLVHYVAKVVESTETPEVRKYVEQKGISEPPSMGVVVQEMLNPDASGVAFGFNPMNSSKSEFLVTAVWGLGEGLVSGDLVADTWVIDSRSGEVVNEELAEKTEAYRLDKEGGLVKRKVNKSKISLPCLPKKHLDELCQVLIILEQHFGYPQDIEFAYEDDVLTLLQTRPVTTLSFHEEEGEYTLWDNSNIVESYPGITTPLTYSFISKMYEFVYKQFVKLMGVSERETEERKEVFAQTLGLVRGRVYYNLLSWYKMLAMLPGYSVNARYMETMMGVKEKFELPENWIMEKGRARISLVKMILGIIGKQLRLRKHRKQFLTHLNLVMKEYNTYDFHSMNEQEIIEKYKHFEQTLLLEWKAPLINDFFAMIWFGMLQKFVTKQVQDRPNIHNDLLCGSADIISVQPIKRLMDIKDMIEKTPELCELFKTNKASHIWEQINSFPEIADQLRRYLLDFGDRCVGELKLESVSYSQDPLLLVELIQQYIVNDVRSLHGNGLEEKIRKEAEEIVSQSLRGKWLKMRWYRFLLSQTRDLVSNRENLRYERTRGFGMVRKMLVALGDLWVRDGKLKERHELFYLELEEILSGYHSDYKRIIEHRKNEFASYRDQLPPQERFFSYGNDFSDRYIYSNEKEEIITGDLKGIGCCPGIVEGKVKIITDPTAVNSVDNDILVTSSTDPGWVTLFPTCSAILVERGSLLSHSAIVSREMGIPCIVGVKGLLKTLETGDRVKMDGSTGIVKRIIS